MSRARIHLPRGAAVEDIAEMQTEPPKAEPPKRKRRWFQFSLWTLTIAVAIVSVGCAICLPMLREWQQRQQEQADFEELIKLIYPGP